MAMSLRGVAPAVERTATLRKPLGEKRPTEITLCHTPEQEESQSTELHLKLLRLEPHFEQQHLRPAGLAPESGKRASGA
eukprot:826019-Amphidinium_carterae.2